LPGVAVRLRKREIDTLLWTSVDFTKAVIRIERTKYFQPKSEDSAGEVDLSLELVAILENCHQKKTGEFVVESGNLPRYEKAAQITGLKLIFEALYQWLADNGLTARKKLYELRKECGSFGSHLDLPGTCRWKLKTRISRTHPLTSLVRS